MRAANVTWNGISLHNVKEMEFTSAEFTTYALRRRVPTVEARFRSEDRVRSSRRRWKRMLRFTYYTNRTGPRQGQWAMTVNGRWRVTFGFGNGDAHGERAVTAETAVRLGRYLGTGPEFWMTLQTAYDIATVDREKGRVIENEVPATARMS